MADDIILFEGKLISLSLFEEETKRLKEKNHQAIKEAVKHFKNKDIDSIFNMKREEKDKILDKFRGCPDHLKNRPILHEGKLINENEYKKLMSEKSFEDILKYTKECIKKHNLSKKSIQETKIKLKELAKKHNYTRDFDV